jgi:hypothetical protein
MAAPAIILGQLAAPLVPHLIRFGHEKAVPAIEAILTDPGGFASRVGDIVIWNGSHGQKVLAGLQTLGESQQRIEQAVTSIESGAEKESNTEPRIYSTSHCSARNAGLGSLASSGIWRGEPS